MVQTCVQKELRAFAFGPLVRTWHAVVGKPSEKHLAVTTLTSGDQRNHLDTVFSSESLATILLAAHIRPGIG